MTPDHMTRATLHKELAFARGFARGVDPSDLSPEEAAWLTSLEQERERRGLPVDFTPEEHHA